MQLCFDDNNGTWRGKGLENATDLTNWFYNSGRCILEGPISSLLQGDALIIIGIDDQSKHHIISYIFHNCSSSELEVAWLNLRLQRKQLRRWCWWTTWGWRACKVKLREWSLISSSASPEPLCDQQWMRGRTKLSVMTTAPWHNYYALKTTSPPAPTSAKYFHQTKHRHEAHKHFKSTSHTWHFKSKKRFTNF